MDSLSFRLANQLLHNDDHCAGLEIIVTGPTLRFNMTKQIVLTGATIQTTLDDEPLQMGVLTQVNAGQTLRLGKITAPGARSYLAVAGGFQCPDYLGSKSTFTLGQFGGHTGRALRSGDVLQLDPSPSGRTAEKSRHIRPHCRNCPIAGRFMSCMGRMVRQTFSQMMIFRHSLPPVGRCISTLAEPVSV
jgi:urea carboxylase